MASGGRWEQERRCVRAYLAGISVRVDVLVVAVVFVDPVCEVVH